MCNVSGSAGAVSLVPGSRPPWPEGATGLIEIDLYDQLGAFVGARSDRDVPIDKDPHNCGVCVRSLGDKGTSGAKEYFATAGTVTVS